MTECDLCFHKCHLNEGQTGFCRARKNVEGKIIPINYAKVTSIQLDPIEKKPLKKFFPGSKILSIGSFGCNLRCPFCQNFTISTMDEHQGKKIDLFPQQAVSMALSMVDQGNIGIAFTYNEPLVSYEYVYDTSVLAKQAGLKTVVVTNGTIEAAPLRKLLPYIDAFNIDLKGFTQTFYDKLNGNLEQVKRTIEIANESSHVEVTTLVIPGENDDDETMEALAKWLASVNPAIPLHLTRFFPAYLWRDKPATPIDTLYHLRDIALKYVSTVYLGNI